MKKTIKPYFTEEEEQSIINSIREAENMTSGEIRIHISENKDADPLNSAKKIFTDLEMFKTKYRNGVLIHISLGSKTFSIIGDEGIDNIVPPDFWKSTRDIIQKYFKQGEIALGICQGVYNVGLVLKKHFPLEENDINELADEITYD